MARYTLELRELIESNIPIFDFSYPFFAPGEKNIWEKKFINHYFFDEIGSETIERWKHQLQSRLEMLFPKYEQLYKTELATVGIDFLRNKDLIETFERELNSNNDMESTQNSSSNINTNSQNESYNNTTNNINQNNTLDSVSNNTENRQESKLENGLASVSLNIDSITGVEKNINDTTSKDTTNTTLDSTIKNNSQGTNSEQSAQIGEVTGNNKTNSNTREVTTLRSNGNIGVTSSAELLEKWRRVLIDLQGDMIRECKDLFMLVY